MDWQTWESPGSEPRALWQLFPVRLLWLAAVSGATAFTFAGVFAFATGVTSLAAALAFTGVLSFAGVRTLLAFCQGLQRDSGLGGCAGCIGANREGSGHEPGHRGARDECFCCFHFGFWFLAFLSSPSCGSKPRREVFKMVEVRIPLHEDYVPVWPDGSPIFPPFPRRMASHEDPP